MPSIAGLMRAISRDGYEVYQLKLNQERQLRQIKPSGARGVTGDTHVQVKPSAHDRAFLKAYVKEKYGSKAYSKEFRFEKYKTLLNTWKPSEVVTVVEPNIDIGKWTKFKLWCQSLPPFSHHTKESYQAVLQAKQEKFDTPVHLREDVLAHIPSANVTTTQQIPLLVADERNGLAEAADMTIQEYNARLISRVSEFRHEEDTIKNLAKTVLKNDFKNSTESVKEWQKRHMGVQVGEINHIHILRDGEDQPLIVEPSVNRGPMIKPERALNQTHEEFESDILLIDKRKPAPPVDQVDQPVVPQPTYVYHVPRKAAPPVIVPVEPPSMDPASIAYRAQLRDDLLLHRGTKSFVEFVPRVDRFETKAVQIHKNESVPARDIRGRDTTGKTTYVDDKGAFILYGKSKHDVVKMYLKNDVPQHVVLPEPVSYLDFTDQAPKNPKVVVARRSHNPVRLQEETNVPAFTRRVPPPVDDFTPKKPVSAQIKVEATVETPVEDTVPLQDDPVDDVISQVDLDEEFVNLFMEGVDNGRVWTNQLKELRKDLVKQGEISAHKLDVNEENQERLLAGAKEDYFDIKAQLQLHQLQDDQEAYAQCLTKFYYAQGYYNTLRERLYDLEPVVLSKRTQQMCQIANIDVSFKSEEMVRAMYQQRHNFLVDGKTADHVEVYSVPKALQDVRNKATYLMFSTSFDSEPDQKIIFDAIKFELDKTQLIIKRLHAMCQELISKDPAYSTLKRVDKKVSTTEKLINRWNQDIAMLNVYEAHLVGSLIGFSQKP